MATKSTAKSPYTAAVQRLADIDPVTRAPDEFLERLGAVFDEVPAFSDRRWELIVAMETMLSAEETVSAMAGGTGRLIADLRLEQSLKAEVRRSVFAEPMLTAEAVAAALGSHSVNPRQYANTKRRRGELLGLPVKNRYLFPAFQIDAGRSRMVPVVARVNGLLLAPEDPWGVASWWFSVNGWLGRKRPADLVGDDKNAAAVLEAARAEVEPIG